MSGHGYTLPPTAICPGCGTMVVLPKEPIFADSPPAICGTCESEVPDYRRDSYTPPSPEQQHFVPRRPAAPTPTPVETTPIENRRYSRANLFKSLGGIIAERGVSAVESAKDRFPT